MIRCPDDVQRLARVCTQVDRTMLRLPAVVAYVAVVAHYEELPIRQNNWAEIVHVQLSRHSTRVLHIWLIKNIAIPVDARRAAVDGVSSDRRDALNLPDWTSPEHCNITYPRRMGVVVASVYEDAIADHKRVGHRAGGDVEYLKTRKVQHATANDA